MWMWKLLTFIIMILRDWLIDCCVCVCVYADQCLIKIHGKFLSLLAKKDATGIKEKERQDKTRNVVVFILVSDLLLHCRIGVRWKGRRIFLNVGGGGGSKWMASPSSRYRCDGLRKSITSSVWEFIIPRTYTLYAESSGGEWRGRRKKQIEKRKEGKEKEQYDDDDGV